MPAVRANQMLFDKWNHIGSRISSLRVIVQNDMEITDKDICEWVVRAQDLSLDLDELITATATYIDTGEV